MELLPPGSALNALMPRETPVVPKELFGYLAEQTNLDTWEMRLAAEREIQTQLQLYDLLFDRDLSAIPDPIRAELQHNRGACMALLLYLQCRAAVTGTVPDLVNEIAESEPSAFPKAAIPFIIDNIVWLLLSNNDDRLIEALETASRHLPLSDNTKRVIQLAHFFANFSPNAIPAAISELIDLHKGSVKPDATSIAAHYLLGRIYGRLGLPFEEKDCYSHWRASLATLHNKTPALVAASYSQSEPHFTRTIIEVHRRWVHLLRAASETKAVDEIVAEFETAGYAQEFSEFKNHEDRQPGYECILVTREQVSDATAIMQMISKVLTGAARSKACLILKDDSLGEIDDFPKPKARNLEGALISGLTSEVADLNLLVEQEPVEESVMGGRRWILCSELENPVSAIAIGILPAKLSISICYARSVAFDTRLSQDKGKKWIEETTRLLAEQCDAQKLSKLREAVKKILRKATAGRKAAKWTKVRG